MPSTLLRALAVILACVAAIPALLWVQYSRLRFNSEGRYFDAVESVVYLEQSKLTFGIAALACGSACIAAELGGRRLRRRRRH